MILAIETSCDDSAVALLDYETGEVIYEKISSQINLHEKFGGVVPELASRGHLASLPMLLHHLKKDEGYALEDLKAVAVTYAPGLIGSLLIGVSYAKTLAWTQGIPLIPVDHLEGHLLAPFLDHDDLEFPFLGLVASGGHTHLILAQAFGEYQLLGKTIDDAAGEAFDKAAKMMGFKYPGGPVIDKIAQECKEPTYELPIPLRGKKTLNFSYSGLKTAVKYLAQEEGLYAEKDKLISYQDYLNLPEDEYKKKIRNLAASFQKTMAETIYLRCREALKITGVERLVLSGGVAANSAIRASLEKLAKNRKIRFYAPEFTHCTDNAAMIGQVAWRKIKAGAFDEKVDLTLNPSPFSPLNKLEVTSLF